MDWHTRLELDYLRRERERRDRQAFRVLVASALALAWSALLGDANARVVSDWGALLLWGGLGGLTWYSYQIITEPPGVMRLLGAFLFAAIIGTTFAWLVWAASRVVQAFLL